MKGDQKCEGCGKFVDHTIQISTPRGKKTPNLCTACFKKSLRKAAEYVKREKQT
jgi:hypothetical protein